MALNYLKTIWSKAEPPKEPGNPCERCDACKNVVHGSVTPHEIHILVRLTPPEGTPPTTLDHLWWPEKVDSHPAIVAVNTAIKAAGDSITGPVKVTAFEYPQNLQVPPQPPGTADVLLFPTAVKLSTIPITDLGEAVVRSLSIVRTSDSKLALLEERITDLSLIICCHVARDARCGYLGPLLAHKLEDLGAQVYLSSHIGGHQYAGNVISYGNKQPSAGTWFGGLSVGNAEEFYTALTALPLSGDPAEDTVLRKYWRGRVGLSKDEQAKHFIRCGRALHDIEDSPDASA